MQLLGRKPLTGEVGAEGQRPDRVDLLRLGGAELGGQTLTFGSVGPGGMTLAMFLAGDGVESFVDDGATAEVGGNAVVDPEVPREADASGAIRGRSTRPDRLTDPALWGSLTWLRDACYVMQIARAAAGRVTPNRWHGRRRVEGGGALRG